MQELVLFHVTGRAAYVSIMRTGWIKPGPRNVWVARKPTGYVRKGGKVWLVDAVNLQAVIAHLQRLNKPTEYVIGVKVKESEVKRFNPMRGVYTCTHKVKVVKARRQWTNNKTSKQLKVALEGVIALPLTPGFVGRSRTR